MTRIELEHLIRAAAGIANDNDIVVIGSQAILGQFPEAPESMRISTEADLYPLHHPERADRRQYRRTVTLSHDVWLLRSRCK
jgi:hypothetical protein